MGALERRPHRHGRGFVFPIFLIVVGVLLLLQTLGVLPWDLWATLWRFWPVLLILLGLSIVLRRASPWVMPGITLLVLAGVVGAAVAIDWPLLGGGTYTKSFNAPLDGVERARVEIEFGAGKLYIASLLSSSENLVEGEFSGTTGEVETSFRRSDGEATLKLSRAWSVFGWRSVEEDWSVRLTGRIPLELDIDAGASDADLDLTELVVSNFSLDTGAADLEVRFPRGAGTTEARIKAGAAKLELVVPQGVAASISVDSGLSSVSVDEERFPKAGGKYESPDFASAQNRLTLDIAVGAASVTVR